MVGLLPLCLGNARAVSGRLGNEAKAKIITT